MAAIDFPNSPTQGDTFTASDKTWVYIDGKWTLPSVDANGLVTLITSASSGQFLKWNGSAWVNDTIDLSADTTGSFIASLVAGTGVTLANNSGEAATPTVTVDTTVIAPLASPTFTGTVSGITKTMVGLGNVDNTSDANKPVSTAQQTALDLKANLASPTFTGTVSGISATMVGLGNVDNTSDANKPVSTATQTALDLKANLASPTFTGTVSGISATMVGLGNVDNTSDANKPVSTAQQTALNLKANLASPTFTGTVIANDLTVSGNLTVSGTTTSINTETLTVDDNIVVLNNNVTASPTENAGIEVERGTSTNVQIRWNETTDKWQFTNDGSTYTDLGAGGAFISDTPPASPVLGQVWFESDTAKTYVYYDSQWIEIGALAAAGIVTMSDTAPVSPADGKLWFNSSTAKTYVYYDSAWVEIGAGSNPASLNDIGDVAITSATNGQFLRWDDGAWVNKSITTTTTRTNLVTNPNFETNTTGWVGQSATIARITSDAFIGSACVEVTKSAVANGRIRTVATTAADRIPVTSGLPYRISAYVKVPTGQPSCSLRIRTTEWQASGTRNPDQVSTATVVTDTDGWVRLSLADTPTAGATPTVTMTMEIEENTTNARVYLVDACLFEQSSSLLPYFDGTYADAYAGYTLTSQSWTGTADASTSTAIWATTSSVFLDDIANVAATSPTSGQVLQWNGTAWVNAVGFSGNKQAILGNQIFG